MILTKEIIKREIDSGRIVIEPYDEQKVQVASYDLALGNKFRTYKSLDVPVELVEDTDYKEFTEEIEGELYILRPRETILGTTDEKVTLPGDICGLLEGRSRFARLGLTVHTTAGLINPGTSNHTVLEITNLGPLELVLRAHEKICQIVFVRCEGSSFYGGHFQGQNSP